jgi:hypothetical protein
MKPEIKTAVDLAFALLAHKSGPARRMAWDRLDAHVRALDLQHVRRWALERAAVERRRLWLPVNW